MSRDYKGPIEVGMTFLWEPFIPHATEHLKVTRITGPGEDQKIEHATGTAIISGGWERRIYSRSYVPLNKIEGFYDGNETWNSEGRFREAVILVPPRATKMEPPCPKPE